MINICERKKLKIFYDELGEKYPEREIVYNTLSGILRKKFIVSKLNSMSGSLLDLGCGEGVYCEFYAHEQYIGMDLSSTVIKRAKKMKQNIDFGICDVQNLNIRNFSVDNVLCTEVLEHLTDPEKAFKEIVRVLRPGGILLLTTPNYFSLIKPKLVWSHILEKFGVKKMEYLHTAFKPLEIKKLANINGLHVLEYGTIEKEIVYSTKLTIIFEFFFNLFNKSIRLPDSLLFEKISISTYYLLNKLKLDKILNIVIKEGGRTYIFAQKKG